MKRVIAVLMMLIGALHARGQEVTRHEADSLLKSIKTVGRKGNDRISSLLELASFNILKPGEDKPDLDSAETFINQAQQLNFRLRSPEASGYLKLLNAYLIKERGQDPKINFKQAVDYLTLTKDKFHLAMADLELSKFYNSNIPAEATMKQSLMDQAAVLVQNNGTLSQKAYGFQELKHNYIFGASNDPIWRIKFLDSLVPIVRQLQRQNNLWGAKEIADIHMQQGYLGIAKNELLQLVSVYKASGAPKICNVYDLLTALYFRLGDYKQSLYYAFKTIDNMHTAEDSSALESFYLRFVNVYKALGNQEKARAYLQKSMDIHIAGNNANGVYIYVPKIADCYIQENKPKEALEFTLEIQRRFPAVTNGENKLLSLALAKCYDVLNQDALADQYYFKMNKFSQLQIVNGEIHSDLSADQETGWHYLKRGQLKKAEKYLTKAFDEIPQNSVTTKRLFKYNYSFKLDSAAGKFIPAIQQLNALQKFKDSTFTAIKSRQIEELNISYETEQKKRDIKLLQNKERTQQKEIEHAATVRNWIITAAFALLLLLGINYYQYRLKQKSNKLLEAQKEKIGLINNSLNLLVTEKDEVLLQKENLIKEKEWLLKEVHHRVKNNLHTVICLLESQAVYLENDALKAIESSQHRIYAMSLIHQKLYQSDDIKTIDMHFYIPEFIQYLNESFGTQKTIRFHIEIEPIQLGVSQAIPLALIVNEAITNSIKYAFTSGYAGVITITMIRKGDYITLVIADNGVGLDSAIIAKPQDSLGMKLMNGLSEDINAKIKFDSNKGTRITITFNVDPLHAEDEIISDLLPLTQG